MGGPRGFGSGLGGGRGGRGGEGEGEWGLSFPRGCWGLAGAVAGEAEAHEGGAGADGDVGDTLKIGQWWMWMKSMNVAVGDAVGDAVAEGAGEASRRRPEVFEGVGR